MRSFHLKSVGASVLAVVLIPAIHSASSRGKVVGDEVTFSDVDSTTTRRVAQLIEARHFEKQPIDDAVSIELFEDYIDAWDPNRLYFLKSDIDTFANYRTSLDDQVKVGQLSFASTVFDRFMSRCVAAQSIIEETINADHDFTVEESTLRDGTERPWGTSPAEVREYWRKTIKLQLLNLVLDGENEDEARATLKQRYQTSFNLVKQTDSSEVLELYLSTMMRCLDPHSRYFSPQSEDEFQMDMSLQLTGIGAQLRHEHGQTVVEEIVPGGAAFSDGRLQSEDVILAVGQGAEGPMNDIVGLKLQSVVEQIRGRIDTVVRLRIKRATTDETMVVKLTRQRIELKAQEVSGQVIDSKTWVDGDSRKLGVLRIPSFYRDFRNAAAGNPYRSAARDTDVILKQFRDAGVDAVVVDIRNNTGGALAEAVELTGLFIPTGPVVQMVARDTDPQVLADQDDGLAWDGPLVVLINRQTASASEIFAAAVKDYRRGIVVGDSSTHGKGSVQNIVDIRRGSTGPDQGAIKLTVGAWHGVTGTSSQVTGVTSDVVLPSETDMDIFGEGSLQHPIANTTTQQAKYLPFQDLRTDGSVAEVRQKSAERIRKSAEFARTIARMEFARSQQDAEQISLNLIERQQLRQKVDDLTEEASTTTEDSEASFARNFYNREVVQTTVDFLNALAAD